MSKKIKAIPTEYNGYRFRSRLEARWAVFFDTIKEPYRYEPEGFDLELDGIKMRYLPDFYLVNHKIWVEIKPLPELDEREAFKIIALARYEEVRAVWLFMGEPRVNVDVCCFEFVDGKLEVDHSRLIQCPCTFKEGGKPPHLAIGSREGDDILDALAQTKWIQDGYTAATQARFEGRR